MEFYYSRDVRDFFLPGGGASKLTLRKLLILVDRLPPESAFRSAVGDRVPISAEAGILMDIFKSLSGEEHPRWQALKNARERERREKLIEVKRAKARAMRAARGGA